MAEPKVARKSDPISSHIAAAESRPRRLSQRMRILKVYAQVNEPICDDDAAFLAKVEYGWKRCSELRQLGYIKHTGYVRLDGRVRMVCKITKDGRKILANLTRR